MKKIHFLLAFSASVLLSVSCSQALSSGQKHTIGKKIWQNECSGQVAGLTTWNAGEEFPSIGIGHFIWYPDGFRGRFSESWPEFVQFSQRRGNPVPRIGQFRHSPWSSKSQFQAAFNQAEMKDLRFWLSKNVTQQTEFIIERSKAALPAMLAAAPRSDRGRIEQNYHKVASSPQGTYALIDYVNFKGEGTNPSERYAGRGWGLLQVLGEMQDSAGGSSSATEFAAAAKRVLTRRVQNAPSARGEKRWLAGWHNRCSTYARPL